MPQGQDDGGVELSAQDLIDSYKQRVNSLTEENVQLQAAFNHLRSQVRTLREELNRYEVEVDGVDEKGSPESLDNRLAEE